MRNSYNTLYSGHGAIEYFPCVTQGLEPCSGAGQTVCLLGIPQVITMCQNSFIVLQGVWGLPEDLSYITKGRPKSKSGHKTSAPRKEAKPGAGAWGCPLDPMQSGSDPPSSICYGSCNPEPVYPAGNALRSQCNLEVVCQHPSATVSATQNQCTRHGVHPRSECNPELVHHRPPAMVSATQNQSAS
jgi:hypothetical protein